MKKITALLLILIFVFSITACGTSKTGNEEGSQNSTEINLPEPAANVDPEDMDWGWNVYPEGPFEDQTSDIWYPATVGENDTDYMYFNNGHSIYKITDGEELHSSWLTDENLHAVVDPEYTEFDFDIVFIDNFTLYDYKTETYYIRGNQEEYQKLFEGKKFVCDSDKGRAIELKSDGEAVFYYQGETENCKWQVIAKRIVSVEFESYSNNYYVFFNDDNKVKSICESIDGVTGVYYPEK